jgi:hypothetical protein
VPVDGVERRWPCKEEAATLARHGCSSPGQGALLTAVRRSRARRRRTGARRRPDPALRGHRSVGASDLADLAWDTEVFVLPPAPPCGQPEARAGDRGRHVACQVEAVGGTLGLLRSLRNRRTSRVTPRCRPPSGGSCVYAVLRHQAHASRRTATRYSPPRQCNSPFPRCVDSRHGQV